MGFKRSDLRAELDAIFEDSANNTWTLPQKNLAINWGIDALWPELARREVVNDIILASGTYEYTSTLATELTEEGFSICELEVSAAPYRKLTDIHQRPGSSYKNGWAVFLPKVIVDANVGKKLKLWYHARHPRLIADEASIAIPASTPVVMYGAMVLCTIFLPKRGHTELDAFIRLIPEWTNLWLKAKQDNIVERLPKLIEIVGGTSGIQEVRTASRAQ